MLTLEQAIEYAKKHKDVLKEDLCAGVEHVENEKLRNLLLGTAHDIVHNVAQLSEDGSEKELELKTLMIMCSRLHVIFEFGRTIGIIMESKSLD